MEQLFHEGNRELLVAEIYKAALGATPSARPLGCLCDLTQSHRAFACEFDLRKREARISAWFNADVHYIDRYNGGLGAENPWLAKGNYFQSGGLVWRGSRIVPDEQLATTRFHQAFLAPQGIGHTLHLVIDLSDGVVSHVILARNRGEGVFGTDDIEIARCFIQHAQKAAAYHKDFATKSFVQNGLSHVVDDAALGVAIIDPPNVVYMSETCKKLLSIIGAPPKSRGETAHHATTNGSTKLAFPRSVAEAVGNHVHSGATRLILDCEDGEQKILVDIRGFSMPANGSALVRRGMTVTFYDLEQRICVDEALLREAYELTASEARICSLLVNGERVEDLSERLNIRPNTARTHLKRIFGKTGSTRQAELVKLVMRTATLKSHSVSNDDGDGDGDETQFRIRRRQSSL